MKLTEKDISQIETLLTELCEKIKAEGWDATESDLLETEIIDHLTSKIEEFT